MNNLVSSEVGLVHLIASILALIFGSLILIMSKGTRRHKQVGYAYVASMLVLLFTSFMLYNLFGGFGVFHIASIVSSVTLLLGMMPVFFKPKNWILYHLSWMYWSVIGLYAAFASEVFTRFFPAPFFSAVGIATVLIMIVGGVGFRLGLKSWKEKFSKQLKSN
ncbi:MAG: DUF2306 domain-containing protein [Ekhidna sp.]|uniref:DUF2306 domain-containing protein n=1 Tax=Ekhidna sp. TaxID=2608089 RepID=UPI0032EB89FE